METIETLTVTERALFADESLDFVSERKRRLFERATAGREPLDDPMHVSRWRRRADHGEPGQWPSEWPDVTVREDVFDYVRTGDGAVDWWLNFADASLFFGWSTGLFAQDELMIAEHPALAALRVRLDRTGAMRPRTVEPDGRATPVLVRGVPRRLAIDLGPRPDLGLPNGIYGNALLEASAETVDAVARPVDPPEPSNVLAMAAPEPESGPYSHETIASILDVAATGFGAVAAESRVPTPARVVVHTGFWGCGAFGGNRELMIASQILAAGATGIDAIVLHTVTASGRPAVEASIATAREVARAESFPDILDALFARDFHWGASNGT